MEKRINQILNGNQKDNTKSILIANIIRHYSVNIEYNVCLKMAWMYIKVYGSPTTVNNKPKQKSISNVALDTITFKNNSKCVNVMAVDEIMKQGYVTFGYYKKDGSFRIFRGTKCLSMIPIGKHPNPLNTVKNNNIRFYDHSINGWRSLSNDTKYVWIMVDQTPF